jgi:hypothetical protein
MSESAICQQLRGTANIELLGRPKDSVINLIKFLECASQEIRECRQNV